jgi:hypothetical protein
MKVLSFFAGLVLLLLCVITGGWLLTTTNFFSITNVSCTTNKEQCPPETQQQLENMLLTKSLFLTDFNRELQPTNFTIHSFSKKIPGMLAVEVSAKSSNKPNTTLDTPQVKALVTDTFENMSLPINKIIISEPENYVVITIEDLQIIVSFDTVETDLEKAVVILTNLDLNTIDLDISEIDTRYKLPVLRTTKTRF